MYSSGDFERSLPFNRMIMRIILLFVLFVSFRSHGSIEVKPWQPHSNPARMSPTYNKLFSLLPLKAKVSETNKYWSSDYWPLQKGNINLRWNSKTPVGFNLKSPTLKEAMKMTEKELSELSPSEKFDLFRGDYQYTLKKEVAKRSSPNRKIWEGICHGWAAAALNHIEPKPKILKNPDGVLIPFGSSDIKALLSYYYAYKYDPVSTYQIGRRCNGRQYCDHDMNAGAFHVILANQVGLSGKGFIADIENGQEVWNQVAFDYVTTVLRDNLLPARDSARGTEKVIRVKTQMRVVFNIIRNSWFPVNGTPLQTFKMNDYEYDLDLDKDGKIIGGDWRSKLRPDFLWTAPPVTHFQGIFQKLNHLL